MNEIAELRGVSIVLHDGSRIELTVDAFFEQGLARLRGVSEGVDEDSGKARITTFHILDGGFEIEDVSEVIVYSVGFKVT